MIYYFYVLVVCCYFVTLVEATDDLRSYCFNGCSGHGNCEKYTCTCEPGWHGADCSVTFSSSSDDVYPTLSVGDVYLSSDNYTAYVRDNSPLLIGVSATSCDRCARFEEEYSKALRTMRESQQEITFARIDLHQSHDLATRLYCVSIPCLVWVDEDGTPNLYAGVQNAPTLVEYMSKQLGPKVADLRSIHQVGAALQGLVAKSASVRGAVMVLGMFRDTSGDEKDEWEEFSEAAKLLQHRPDISFSAVRMDKNMPKTEQKLFLRSQGGILLNETPSIVVARVSSRLYRPKKKKNKKNKKKPNTEDDTILNKVSKLLRPCSVDGGLCEQHGKVKVIHGSSSQELVLDVFHVSLLEPLPGRMPLERWLEVRSIPLVDHLNPQNFPNYERVGLPMLILFAGAEYLAPALEAGQANLLTTMSQAASFYRDRISFVTTDSRAHSNRMRSLALFQGDSGKPVFAINSGNDQLLPPLEQETYTVQDLRNYCDDFLVDRLPSLTPRDVQLRKEASETSAEVEIAPVQGVLEEYGPDGTDNIGLVDSSTFEKVVMSEYDQDIVLLFHKRNDKPSMGLAPFFKRCANRLAELGVSSVRIVRMDITEDAVPLGFEVAHIPTIVLLPALHREPPFVYYSGVGKVLPMMQWIAANVKRKFELPELPQFNDKDRELYKIQVEDREKNREQRDEL